MASAPVSRPRAADVAPAQPDLAVARATYLVPLDQIDPSGGLRPLDMAWVEALSGLMAADGQEDPIEIYPKPGGGYGVTAGRHRLAAAGALEWPTIEAFIDPASRRREVSENLFKLGLGPLDRAAFVAELVDLEKARAGVAEAATPQSVAAAARWADRLKEEAADACANVARAYGFAEEVAEKIGLSRRSIYLALELHRGVRPAVAAALRGHPVAQNAAQLRALARLSEDEQHQAAELITGGQARTVSEAVAVLKQKPVADPAVKAWSAFIGSWGRLKESSRKEALRTLAEGRLPKGVTVIIDGVSYGDDQ